MDCGGEDAKFRRLSSLLNTGPIALPYSNGPKQHLFIKVVAERWRRNRTALAIIMQKCKFAIQSIKRLTPIIKTKNEWPEPKFGGWSGSAGDAMLDALPKITQVHLFVYMTWITGYVWVGGAGQRTHRCSIAGQLMERKHKMISPTFTNDSVHSVHAIHFTVMIWWGDSVRCIFVW